MMVETSSLRKAAMPVLVVLALSAARACLNSVPFLNLEKATVHAACVTSVSNVLVPWPAAPLALSCSFSSLRSSTYLRSPASPSSCCAISS